MIKISIEYGGLIQRIMSDVQKALNVGVGVGTSYLGKKFKERLKTRHYSLQQLRAMGHPYSRFRFSIAMAKRYGKKLPTLSNPIERRMGTNLTRVRAYGALITKVRTDIINRQTGKLLRSVEVKSTATSLKASNKLYASGVVYIPDSVRYAEYVFFGTKRLIPRPIHLLVAEKEKHNVAQVIENEMYKFLRGSVTKIFD